MLLFPVALLILVEEGLVAGGFGAVEFEGVEDFFDEFVDGFVALVFEGVAAGGAAFLALNPIITVSTDHFVAPGTLSRIRNYIQANTALEIVRTLLNKRLLRQLLLILRENVLYELHLRQLYLVGVHDKQILFAGRRILYRSLSLPEHN